MGETLLNFNDSSKTHQEALAKNFDARRLIILQTVALKTHFCYYRNNSKFPMNQNNFSYEFIEDQNNPISKK